MHPRRPQPSLRPVAQALGTAVTLVLLTGCATYEPKPLTPADTASAFDQRSLESPALRAFIEQQLGHELKVWPPVPARPPGWTLPLLTLAAYYYHPSLEVARANWAEAQAAIITAGGRPNPTLTLSPGYNFNAASGVTPWMPGVAFDLPLETMGKRGLRVLRAQYSAEAARWQLAATAWQVRAGVRDALLNYNDAAKRFELLHAQHQLHEQWLQRLQERAAAGAISRAELMPTRIALEKLRLEINEMMSTQPQARIHLAEALGVPGAALNRAIGTGAAWSFPTATHLTTTQARQHALTHRADIAALLAEYEAAQAALRLEIARQYPDVHLGSGFQWDQGESKWTFLNVSAELPVLNRNQGPIAEAQARRASAAARVEAAQAKAVAEIGAAFAAHAAALGRVNSTELLTTQHKRQAENIEAQVRAGALDVLDRIGAQLELAQWELIRWDANVKAMQALARLEDVLQTPLDSDHSAAAPGSLVETNPRAAKETP
ncbi:MAG: TolC family protein [Proteobacteria bacterium]|nr:TolC family protein [Pseudomonadota bacterium]